MHEPLPSMHHDRQLLDGCRKFVQAPIQTTFDLQSHIGQCRHAPIVMLPQLIHNNIHHEAVHLLQRCRVSHVVQHARQRKRRWSFLRLGNGKGLTVTTRVKSKHRQRLRDGHPNDAQLQVGPQDGLHRAWSRLGIVQQLLDPHAPCDTQQSIRRLGRKAEQRPRWTSPGAGVRVWAGHRRRAFGDQRRWWYTRETPRPEQKESMTMGFAFEAEGCTEVHDMGCQGVNLPPLVLSTSPQHLSRHRFKLYAMLLHKDLCPSWHGRLVRTNADPGYLKRVRMLSLSTLITAPPESSHFVCDGK
eukprot:m.104015 g.104015  ORF g.104015 m.104015 type:complete len:300 (+) comp10505_c0_seq1:135-1034(+)